MTAGIHDHGYWITAAHGGGPDPAALDPMTPQAYEAEQRREAEEMRHSSEDGCLRGCWVCRENLEGQR